MRRNVGRFVSWTSDAATVATTNRVISPKYALALVASLLVLVGLLGMDQQPPRAAGPDAPAGEFSAARAIEVLEVIAAAPHAIGQPNHGYVRDHLIEQLQGQGHEVEVQAASTDGHHTTYNLLVTVPGTAGTTADTILVVAHYDSVPNAPGAADDGVGTVAVVETARAILAGPPLRNDVVFLLTDGEERGLWGAKAYVASHPGAADVDLVINHESGGPRGPLTLLEIDQETPSMVRDFGRAAPRPVTSSLLDDIVPRAAEAGVANTDFWVFRELDQPGFNFANSKDTGFRHTPGDELWRIDPATVQHHGASIVGLVREYGDRDLDQVGGTSGAVWVAVFTWLVLAWSRNLAWVMLGLVVVALAVLARGLRRGPGLTTAGVLTAIGGTLGAIVASMLTTMSVVGFIQLVRPDHGPHYNGFLPRLEFPGAGAPGEELYWFAAIFLATAAACLVLARVRRRVSLADLVFGTNLLFVLLAALSTNGVPGASYLFTIPLLFLLPANTWWLTRLQAGTATWAATAVIAVGAIPTVAIAGNLLVFFQTFLVPNATLLAPLVALYVAQLVPVAELAGSADRRLPVVGSAAVGGVLLTAGLLTVSVAPVMLQEQWVGPTPENQTTRTPVAAVADWPGTLELVTYDSGRHCVSTTWFDADFAWCPLPAAVAPPIDVQHLREADRVLLFGSAPTASVTLRIEHADGAVEVAAQALDGVPGRFFAGSVAASIGHITRVVALDATGAAIAEAAGFDLAQEGSDRHSWED